MQRAGRLPIEPARARAGGGFCVEPRFDLSARALNRETRCPLLELDSDLPPPGISGYVDVCTEPFPQNPGPGAGRAAFVRPLSICSAVRPDSGSPQRE